jgi:hypothetical protein
VDCRSAAQLLPAGHAELSIDPVVGADGPHSQVHRLAFGPDEQFERYLGIVVAAFEVKGASGARDAEAGSALPVVKLRLDRPSR